MDNRIIKVDGTEINSSPTNSRWYTLKELQTIVGGAIEILCLDNSKYMVVNEDGKPLGLEVNKEATKIFIKDQEKNRGYIQGENIVGNILVCDRKYIQLT